MRRRSKGLFAGGVAAALGALLLFSPFASGQGECPNEEVREAQGTTDLPDCRAYELVSPANKSGAVGVGGWYNHPTRIVGSGFAALEGERLMMKPGTGATVSYEGVPLRADVTASERSESGWAQHPVLTRHLRNKNTALEIAPSVRSDDLSTAFYWGDGGKLLNFWDEMADWPPHDSGVGTAIGSWEGRWEPFAPISRSKDAPPEPVAIAPDGSIVAVSSRSLGAGGTLADPAPGHEGGRITIAADVSGGLSDTFPGEAPRSNVAACTDEGGRTTIPARAGDGSFRDQQCPPPLDGREQRLVSPHGAALRVEVEQRALTGVLSENGDRIFFMSPDPAGGHSSCSADTGADTFCPAQLYVRQEVSPGTYITRWISKPVDELLGEQDAGLLASTEFLAASRDGDKVVFRTATPLTTDDPNGIGAAPPDGVTTGTASNASKDLYLYDFPDDPDADPGEGKLTRITGGPEGDQDPSSIAYAGRGISADGNRIFFATDDIVAGAPTAEGATTSPTSGQPNLYLYDLTRPQAERWTFIGSFDERGPMSRCSVRRATTAQQALARSPNAEAFQLPEESNCLRTTDDGAFTTFFTQSALTDADADDGIGDIYGFDAETQKLELLSAPQGGAGGSYDCDQFSENGADPCRADPGAGSYFAGLAARPEDPSDRTAFFNSKVQLVAEDSDDAYDVYQWKNGELSLLTPGDSSTDGQFYQGNSRDGLNVYFVTRDRMNWEDSDAVADIYTLRRGGGFAEPVEPEACDATTGACLAPSEPAPAELHVPTAKGTP